MIRRYIKALLHDLKGISAIALPLVFQGLVYQLQTLTDRKFLGNLDIKYLSVVGNTIFPFNITTAVISAFGIGITIKIAQSSKDREKGVEDYCNRILIYNTMIGVVIAAAWAVFAGVIFRGMGVSAELLPYCTKYVRVLCLFVLLLGLDSAVQATLQGLGQTRLIFGVGVIKVVLNVVFDIVFIFGKLGLPQLGVIGAALGTSLANIIANILTIIAIKKLNYFDLKIVGCIKRRSPERFKEVVQTGLPASIETFIWHISNLVLVRFMNSLDDLSVGIYTLIYNLEITVYRVYYGYAKGLVTAAGRSIGQRRYDRAYSKGVSLMTADVFFWAAVCGVSVALAPQILSAFIHDRQVVMDSRIYVYFTAVCILPKSLNSIVGSGIRAAGDTKWMLFTQVIGSVIVISSAYILIEKLHMGLLSIYITLILDESVRCILNLIHYRQKYRRLMAEERSVELCSDF
ncbi:MAG TPA: MATE family efflux transporter [Ruminococcus sp.]|nr:MATE family efflux transporter [Ruminococcus sp.]